MKSNIKSFTLDELKNEMIALGEKVFRAEQIFKWLHQENVQSFEETHNRVFVKGCPIGQPLELFYFKH